MKIAILLYGKNSIDSNLISTVEARLATEFSADIYKNFSTDNEFENLRLACFSKIEKEVDMLTQYNVCVAINIEYHWLLDRIKLESLIQKDQLVYLRGKLINIETYIEHDIFYGNSLIINQACEYKGPTEQPFFNYLKTMNIPVKCLYVDDKTMFEIVP
jgi:hypothetical protein